MLDKGIHGEDACPFHLKPISLRNISDRQSASSVVIVGMDHMFFTIAFWLRDGSSWSKLCPAEPLDSYLWVCELTKDVFTCCSCGLMFLRRRKSAQVWGSPHLPNAEGYRPHPLSYKKQSKRSHGDAARTGNTAWLLQCIIFSSQFFFNMHWTIHKHPKNPYSLIPFASITEPPRFLHSLMEISTFFL